MRVEIAVGYFVGLLVICEGCKGLEIIDGRLSGLLASLR